MSKSIYTSFESQLKDASGSYPADMWDRIQPEIPTYPTVAPGRKFGWLWIGLAILTIGAFALWAIMSSDEKAQIATIEKSATTNITASGLEPETPNQNTAALIPTEQTVETKANQAKATQEPQNLQSKSQDFQPQKSKGENIPNRPVSLDHKAPTHTDLDANELIAQTATSAIEAREIVNDMTNDGQIVDAARTQPSNTITSKGSRSSEHLAPRSMTIVSRLSESQNITALDHSFSKQSQIGIFKPDANCFKFSNRHQSNFTFDVYAGPGYALRTMTSREEDVSNYISAREQTESFKYMFTAGVRINLMMNNGLALRTGAHYTQIGEKFDYVDSSSIRVIWISDTTFIGMDTIINPPMQVIQPGTTVKNIHNRYHSMDIPILLGYDLPLGRMQAGITAGAIVNISAWQRGQFLDPSLEPAFINTDNPVEYFPAYKTTLGLGLYLGASLAVPVTDHIWLFGEPYALHRFDPVTFDDYSIKQTNTNFGINFGLKFKL